MLKSTNTEIIEKKVDVDTALSRMRRPLDLTTVNVEVYGVYSLPELWKQKITENDPNEALYQYEFEVCGMSLKNAKVCPRELTEDEKAEQAAAAGGKGAPAGKQPPPPAKDPKKGPATGPEEPSKEEQEKAEKERIAKEERDKKLKEEWDQLDEETKVFRTAEDIYKQPCIKFNNVFAQKKIELLQQQLAAAAPDSEEFKDIQNHINDLTGRLFTGSIATEKQGFEIVEFEEQIVRDKGCWVRFMKLPPSEEPAGGDPKAAAAKGAPAKGAPAKGAPAGGDMKPYFGRAWLNLDALLQPGALEVKQRVFLETCPPMVKKAGEDGIEKYVQSEEPFDNIFEAQRSYIYIKLTMSDSVIPPTSQNPEPLPQDVVPVKQFIRWPFSKDPTDDFKKQIALAVESLAKEYYNLFATELQEEQQNREKSEKQRQEAFEERKKEFLYEVNTTGKYHIMKEKMKKTIVRIVKEHFGKQAGEAGVKGIYKDERDHFYSQLYGYLVQQMRITVKELVHRKRNELHENVTVPKDQFTQERDRLISVNAISSSPDQPQESVGQRYKRLASEYENLYCNQAEAEGYMNKLQQLNEGDPEMMLEQGKYFLRIGKLEKADQYLRDSLSFNIKNPKLATTYASYLLQINRPKEAIVLLNKLHKDNYEPIQTNLLLSLAFECDSDPLLALKFKAMAFTQKLRDLEVIPHPGSGHENKPLGVPPTPKVVGSESQSELSNKIESAPAFNNHRLNPQQEDELYLNLAESLSKDSMSVLAQRVINMVKDQESITFQQTFGSILLSKRSYDEALKPFQWILSKQDTNLQCICNIGHCHFLTKRFKEAEEQYIKAIRVSSFTGQDLDDPYVLQRLGSIYVTQKQYGEASVIFEECQAKYQNSFSLLNYGITLIYDETKRNFEQALGYLTKANLLNPYNSEIWGYIIYASLAIGLDIQAFQAQKEALKLKLANFDLLKDISKVWIDMQRWEQARESLEMAMRARANKDSSKHQKKLEEFLKVVGESTKNSEEIRSKFKELMVKQNVLKDDDWTANAFIDALDKVKAK